MNSIAFVVPYFGKWPVWFPAFLKSCEFNPSIQWLFFTDCKLPEVQINNVNFIVADLNGMSKRFSDKIGMEVNIEHPVKFCDLKPTFGHVFEEYLNGFDFWGFCDIDIIWGNIRKFITEEMLLNYDLISSRKETISGHFTLLRNNAYNKFLYQTGDYYKKLFNQSKYCWFDEGRFAEIVFEKKKLGEIRVWWERYLVNHEPGKFYKDSHQEYSLDRWFYNNGRLFDLGINGNQKDEYMYLHFINWKIKMKHCDIDNLCHDAMFYVSYLGIRTKKYSYFYRVLNSIKNHLYGFWIQEKIRRQKKQWMKRIRYKLNLK